jgi:hypothetical protein
MMQNHEHYHHDENTITFSRDQIYKPMSIISISSNFSDGRKYFCLSIGSGIFSCEVVPHGAPFPTVEISKEDLETLRKFLNEMKNHEDRKSEV